MANISEDWLKLHRQILENDFLMHDDTAFLVFIKLLLMAGKAKGEVAMSIRSLARKENLNMNYMTLYKTLKRLELNEIVKQEDKQRYTLITICNWTTYQSRGVTAQVARGKHAGNKRVTSGKQLTDEKILQKENKNKKENIRDLIFEYEFLNPELESFVEYRKAKKGFTFDALKFNIDAVQKLYPNDTAMQKASLKQSVMRGWSGVFEVRDSSLMPKNKVLF